MATVNCSALGYSYAGGDFCLPITLKVESDEFTIDKAWIAGAFFLGLLLGAGLTALCVRPFLVSWAKKKRQDEEEILLDDGAVPALPTETSKGRAKGTRFWLTETEPVDGHPKKRNRSTRFKRRKKVIEGKVEVDEALCRGMVDILNSMSAEVEMAEQDMQTIVAMERSQEQEKETLLLKTLEFLLHKKAAKRLVTDNFCDNFIKKTEQDLRDTRHMIEREKEEEEEKLKNDSKLSKNPQALESELQSLQTHFNNKYAKLQRDHKEKIRTDLIKSSGMSEVEVEGVMEKLVAQLSNLEGKIGQEQVRQRRVLEEQLAKRRRVVEFRAEVKKEQQETRDTRTAAMHDLFLLKGKGGQVLEQQIDEFSHNLDNQYDELDKDWEEQWSDTTEHLRQTRLMEMQALLEKQAKERAMYAKKTEATTSIADVVKGYHDLLSRQHRVQEELSNRLDEEDVRKMEQLDKEMKRKEEKGSQEEAERVLETLESLSDISSKEASRLLQQHKQRMEDLQARQQLDRQAMQQRLQEKLQQRLGQASETEAREAREQVMLCEEQSQTIKKVLASNMDLTEEAKEKILKQHEQNMTALSNQLQRNKMRHQKSLEMKLNQRRVKMEDLKKKQEDLKRNRRNMSEKERAKLETDLAQKIAAEEKNLEEARQGAVAELRRQLVAETSEALHVHDEEIGMLIARLQVGQARRKAILERQNKTLNDLQDQLERTGGQEGRGGMTDQVLQKHYNQLDHINRQVQRNKEDQERQLAHRIQQMKSKKKEKIETQLEEDAHQEYTDRQQRGAGYASLALVQSLLDQRHQQATMELEQEMATELEKQKEELNSQMEVELQKELQSQRQTLLTQLAAVSSLPHNELEDAVDATVSGKQNGKQAKRLAKDLKQGIERAKTSMSMDYGNGSRDQEGLDFRRTRTDLEAGDSQPMEMASRRPESAKRFMKKKPAFASDIQEDEDKDF